MKLSRSIAGALYLALSGCTARVPDPGGAPDAAPSTPPVSIPRHHPLPREDRERVQGMNYDPADLPLAFTPDGDLVVAHAEIYTSSDAGAGVCAGSGFYRVPRDGAPARVFAANETVCFGAGRGASSNGAWVVYPLTRRVNGADFGLLELATGRIGTLVVGGRVGLQNPAFSPDGRMIAAVGVEEGRGQHLYSLYVMNRDGSGLREIAAGTGSAARPLWSPDGQRLAYHRSRWQGDGMMVVGVDGTGARAVAGGLPLAWSPDGEWIALLDDRPRGHPTRIYIVRPDGTGRRRVFTNREQGTYSRGWGVPIPEGLPWGRMATWSPDSRWLLFSRAFDEGISIWRVDVASGRLEQVTRPDH